LIKKEDLGDVDSPTTTVSKYLGRDRNTVTQSPQMILQESKFLKEDWLGVQAYGRHASSSLRYEFTF
jgi:hypothetical protein